MEKDFGHEYICSEIEKRNDAMGTHSSSVAGVVAMVML